MSLFVLIQILIIMTNFKDLTSFVIKEDSLSVREFNHVTRDTQDNNATGCCCLANAFNSIPPEIICKLAEIFQNLCQCKISKNNTEEINNKSTIEIQTTESTLSTSTTLLVTIKYTTKAPSIAVNTNLTITSKTPTPIMPTTNISNKKDGKLILPKFPKQFPKISFSPMLHHHCRIQHPYCRYYSCICHPKTYNTCNHRPCYCPNYIK